MLKKVFKTISVFIFVVLIWEIILQTFVLKIPEQKEYDFIGYRPVKDSIKIYSDEGYGIVRYNNYGMLGEDINLNNNREKILFIGDSHTEAIQVMPDKNYISIFSRTIKKLNPNYKFDCINTAYAGGSVGDYIYYSDYYLSEFSPKYVVVQITYDDLYSDAIKSDNIFKLVEENGQLNVKFEGYNWGINKLKGNSFYNLIRRSSLFQALIPHKGKLQASIRQKITGIKKLLAHEKSFTKKATPNDNDTEIYSKYANWSIQKLKEKYGDKLILLYLPYTPYIQDGKIVYNSIENKYKDIIHLTCENNNINLVDMTEEFNNMYKQDNIIPRGFNNSKPGQGHLNIYGHATVGEKLANILEDKIK